MAQFSKNRKFLLSFHQLIFERQLTNS